MGVRHGHIFTFVVPCPHGFRLHGAPLLPSDDLFGHHLTAIGADAYQPIWGGIEHHPIHGHHRASADTRLRQLAQLLGGHGCRVDTLCQVGVSLGADDQRGVDGGDRNDVMLSGETVLLRPGIG
ncbi:hypothetical protein D3C73_958490 [compost metagenome]